MHLQTKIKLATVAVFAFFACVFLAVNGSTQTKVETVGQKYKNIKVLNDLPADQLGKVMNLFAASLGVDCNFCHEGENFEKDGKKPKDDARKMVKMMQSINKDNFNNRPQVTCNSCHNGHHEPQNVPTLWPEAESERPKQPETKPTVDQIVDKYIAALGGKEKLAKITSLTIKANRVEPDGKKTEPESIWYKGNKYASDATYDKVVISERYDGTAATKFVPYSIPLPADEAEQIKREADLFTPANIKTIYPTMAYRGLDRIDGREVYLVTATTKSNVRELLLFDVQTGLLVRRSASTPTMFGRYVYQVDYSDYKAVGGVKMPMTVKYSMPGIRWTRKVISAKSNTPIDDSVFMSPAKKS